MKKLLLIILICLFASFAQAATYYFTDNGATSGSCSIGTPCKCINTIQEGCSGATVTAQTLINDATDVVNLYFAYGDTFQINTNDDTLTAPLALDIDTDDPEVNIDAYDSGDSSTVKPIFDGMCPADFETGIKAHDPAPGDGPVYWQPFIKLTGDNHDIKNIHFKNIYGAVIRFGSDFGQADFSGITIAHNEAENFGRGFVAVLSSGVDQVTGTTIEYNVVHEGGMHDVKDTPNYPDTSWTPAIAIGGTGTAGRFYDTLIRYNVVYNVGGEGIIVKTQGNGTAGQPNIIEYNVIGDSGASCISMPPATDGDGGDGYIRYNMCISTNDTTYNRAVPNYHNAGIVCLDEDGNDSGDNSESDVEIYGNIVINRTYGIWIANLAGNKDDNTTAMKSLKVYNNIIIDSQWYGIVRSLRTDGIYDTFADVEDADFYNNSVIFYESGRTTGSCNAENPSRSTAPCVIGVWGATGYRYTNWDIDNNHFWRNASDDSSFDCTTSDVDSNWDTNCVDGDPKLYGEEVTGIDWDGQSDATYFVDIEFADIKPQVGSSLISSGKVLGAEFTSEFLTDGTDWDADPTLSVWTLGEQQSLWDIGAYEYGTNTLTLIFDQALYHGSNYSDGDLNIDCSQTGQDIALTYKSGNESITHEYYTNQTILASDVCDLDFTCSAGSDCLENSAGVDLATISNEEILNNIDGGGGAEAAFFGIIQGTGGSGASSQ